jgi:hypothetical protein
VGFAKSGKTLPSVGFAYNKFEITQLPCVALYAALPIKHGFVKAVNMQNGLLIKLYYYVMNLVA